MQTFIILFRFQKPDDKMKGPVQQYRVSARDINEAWELAREYANYPGISLINVVPA
jgi:hypothetical protein